VALPLALLPLVRQRFFKITADGLEPLSGGTLQFFIAGTDTPQPVFADSEGDTPLGTTVTLDADGYAPSIYISPIGYKVRLLDEDDVQIFSQDNVEDVGSAFLAYLGQISSEGSKDVESGYEVDEEDNLVTVNEPTTDPATIVLPSAASRGLPVTIKNVGTTAVAVTPSGVETIDTIAAAFTLPAAVSPIFPTVTLIPDGVSGWYIQSSHGIAGL